MSIKVTQLYDADFFSRLGTEYICTGFMYGMSENASVDDQLAAEGVFLSSQVMTDPTTGEPLSGESTKALEAAAQAAQAASTGGVSKPGMGGYSPGSKTGASY